MNVLDPTTWTAPFEVVFAALFVIVLGRAFATYWVGRAAAAGSGRSPRLRRVVGSSAFVAAVARVNRWGAPVVSASFLTVGLQTMVNLAAGFTRMPLTRYVPALVVGGLAWALIYSTVGFVSIGALVTLWQRSPALAVLLGLVLLALFGAFVAWQVRRRDDLSAQR